MSYNNGPKIVTDSLILCVDAGNPKSYPGTGNTWTDLSSVGNNMTLINGPTFTTNNGGGIVTDGVDDNIFRTNTSSLSTFVYATGFSINMWHQSNSSADYDMLCSKVSSDNWDDGFGMFYEFGEVKAFVRDYTVAVSFGPATTNITNWCFTYASGVTRVFKDGRLVNSGTNTVLSNPFNIDASLTINNSSTNNYPLDATIYNFTVYNKQLSAVEVLQNYNALKGRFGQ